MTKKVDYTELIDEFKRTGNMPLLWLWTAREFVCAGNILWRVRKDTTLFVPGSDDNLWKPHYTVWLLYGLALENILKGCWLLKVWTQLPPAS